MDEEAIRREYGNCVWLLEKYDSSDKYREPYLIYDSAESLLADFPNMSADALIDYDVMEFTSYGIEYYATPWPVHSRKS